MVANVDTDHEAAPSLGAKIEVRFFQITRWFIFLCASISAVVAVFFLVQSLYGWSQSPDRSVSVEPPRYSSFTEMVVKKKAAAPATALDGVVRQKEKQAAAAQADLEFEKKLQPLVDKIFSNLSVYATATEQSAPLADGIRSYLKQKMRQVQGVSQGKESLQWSYAEGLVKVTADLSDASGKLSRLAVDDPQRAEYVDVIEWYSKSFIERIQSEHNRIRSEEQAASVAKVEAVAHIVAAASAFGGFAAFTIILVLLRIERNTRKNHPTA
jgi:hypothetical protein